MEKVDRLFRCKIVVSLEVRHDDFPVLATSKWNASLGTDRRDLEETFVSLIKVLDGLRRHKQTLPYDDRSETEIREVLRDLSAFCGDASGRRRVNTVEDIALNLNEVQDRLETLVRLIEERKLPPSGRVTDGANSR